MNRKVSILTMWGLMVLGQNLMAQQSKEVLFHISNLKHAQGIAVVNLFREQDEIPKNPFRTEKGKIENGISKIEFFDLPPGSYAAIVFHDENSNGILDHKFGFPNEPMGFSNKWKLTLFSGMPTFRKLKFQLDGIQKVIEIEMN